MPVLNGQPEASDFRPGKIPLTAEYTPAVYNTGWTYFSKAPPFTQRDVTAMMMDFRIRWGLWMVKGPILCKSKFFIKCDNPQIKEFLIEEVTRFWRSSAMRALKAVEWGYSCSEAVYKVEDSQIRFNYLKDLHSTDCRVLTRHGFICGARIGRVPTVKPAAGTPTNRGRLDLFGPRKFWHVHNRETHPFYGQSRLFGSYFPWLEIWADGGYRDSRRLFFHKYAFDGGGMYVPEGATNMGDDGTGMPRLKSNMVLGREVVEKMKSGGTMIIPGGTDANGKRLWEKIPVEVRPTPSGLMEYGEILKDELWEGMGIPPEIARAQGTGAYAGRIVPLIGFYSILQELIYWLISDVDEQLFRPLVAFNFGPDVRYEIIPFSILDEAMADDGTQGGDEVAGDLGAPQNVQPAEPSSTGKPGSALSQYTEQELREKLGPFLVKHATRGMMNQLGHEPTPMVF